MRPIKPAKGELGVEYLLLALIGCVVVALIVAAVRDAPQPVSVSTRVARRNAVVREWVVVSLARSLRRYGYEITSQSEGQIDAARVYRPVAVMVVTVLLFPVGLIAFFLFRRTSVLTIFIKPLPDDSTELLISGELPGSAARRVVDGLTEVPEAVAAGG